VDEDGQMDREFLAVIDGTLGGPDAIFKLMEFYLRELKITTADKVLFVADGARWIWNRVGALLRRLGVKPDQVNELVDFYHAVEHLGTIAALQRRWTAAERQAWIGRQRRRLLKGGAEEVQAAIAAVCGSRPGKALRRERDYFKRNGGKGRMDYARITALKLPIGSGAIESAIRRVVNLRLKGPSIYSSNKRNVSPHPWPFLASGGHVPSPGRVITTRFPTPHPRSLITTPPLVGSESTGTGASGLRLQVADRLNATGGRATAPPV
jgi:hypothetical protein